MTELKLQVHATEKWVYEMITPNADAYKVGETVCMMAEKGVLETEVLSIEEAEGGFRVLLKVNPTYVMGMKND